jgi:hypothetical protein
MKTQFKFLCACIAYYSVLPVSTADQVAENTSASTNRIETLRAIQLWSPQAMNNGTGALLINSPDTVNDFTEFDQRLRLIERKLEILGTNDLQDLSKLNGVLSVDELIDIAANAYSDRRYEESYATVKQIRDLSPAPELDRKACQIAGLALGRIYNRHRFKDRSSFWYTAEPEVLFTWACNLKLTPEESVSTASALFVGMHQGYWIRFKDFTQKYFPESIWTRLEVTEDNGKVETVRMVQTAERTLKD